MKGIRIADKTSRGILSFDLRDILEVIGSDGTSSTWRCHDLWCIGYRNQDLAIEGDSVLVLNGLQLAKRALQVRQIVDGTFEAYRPDGTGPWLVVKADDSTYWEVFTDDPELLDRLRGRFHSTQPLDDTALPN